MPTRRSARACALFVSLALVVVAAACRPDLCADVNALPDEGDVLVIGDSIFDWGSGRCASVADQLALARGSYVHNEAVNGTRILDEEGGIPSQVKDGDWRFIVLDGGGNDVNSTCNCEDCGQVLDDIAARDASTGRLPRLVDELAATGAHVVLLRYYQMPEYALYGFDRCDLVLPELGRRYDAVGWSRTRATVVDASDVVDPEQIELYDVDRVHPSDDGAIVLGALLADALFAIEASE